MFHVHRLSEERSWCKLCRGWGPREVGDGCRYRAEWKCTDVYTSVDRLMASNDVPAVVHTLVQRAIHKAMR